MDNSEVLIHSFAASYIRSNFSGSSAKRAMKDYGNFILGLKFKQVLAANPTVKSRFESKLKGGDEFPDFMTNVDNNFPDYINEGDERKEKSAGQCSDKQVIFTVAVFSAAYYMLYQSGTQPWLNLMKPYNEMDLSMGQKIYNSLANKWQGAIRGIAWAFGAGPDSLPHNLTHGWLGSILTSIGMCIAYCIQYIERIFKNVENLMADAKDEMDQGKIASMKRYIKRDVFGKTDPQSKVENLQQQIQIAKTVVKVLYTLRNLPFIAARPLCTWLFLPTWGIMATCVPGYLVGIPGKLLRKQWGSSNREMCRDKLRAFSQFLAGFVAVQAATSIEPSNTDSASEKMRVIDDGIANMGQAAAKLHQRNKMDDQKKYDKVKEHFATAKTVLETLQPILNQSVSPWKMISPIVTMVNLFNTPKKRSELRKKLKDVAKGGKLSEEEALQEVIGIVGEDNEELEKLERNIELLCAKTGSVNVKDLEKAIRGEKFWYDPSTNEIKWDKPPELDDIQTKRKLYKAFIDGVLEEKKAEKRRSAPKRKSRKKPQPKNQNNQTNKCDDSLKIGYNASIKGNVCKIDTMKAIIKSKNKWDEFQQKHKSPKKKDYVKYLVELYKKQPGALQTPLAQQTPAAPAAQPVVQTPTPQQAARRSSRSKRERRARARNRSRQLRYEDDGEYNPDPEDEDDE